MSRNKAAAPTVKTDKVLLRLKVVPNASKSQIAGLHGEAIRVRIQAPPVDGKANAALVKFFAEELGIARKQVEVESGSLSQHKTLAITGLNRSEIFKKLGLDPSA